MLNILFWINKLLSITTTYIEIRMTFIYLYDEKRPSGTIDFIKRFIDYFAFRIHSIKIENGT